MENLQSYNGKNFIVHLFNEDDASKIGFSSSYVYPTVDKNELKELADFILKYLENN